MPTVLIVNDQELRRLCYHLLLDSEPDLSPVGEAAGGAEAVRMSTALRPDVVLMHIFKPGTDSIDTVRRIARGDSPPHPRVLVLAPVGPDGYAWAALAAGADALLPENTAPHELTAAIRAVEAGGAVIPPGLTRQLIDTIRRRPPASASLPTERLGALTERERQVLAAVASGWSTTEIAAHLSLAPTTVKSHVCRILTKIGARSRVQAVAFAYESGLTEPHTTRSPLPAPGRARPTL
ncbi:response regulator transcription factor [Streptomyces sporangiiformans]|uniref:Response regulator transcription factor n=1 Tax=Streptomyces sporangiiformans TaxID=2315329 RepID=A0A505D3V0_9ACTN|nr:response regulator transcription factor [Streptomyces sporangiiformans]TPQ18364.1 response regulator transcription factor [Streptomyces sporangiiformans]